MASAPNFTGTFRPPEVHASDDGRHATLVLVLETDNGDLVRMDVIFDRNEATKLAQQIWNVAATLPRVP